MKRIECIKVIGIHRSGTNYLDTLIEQNFTVSRCVKTSPELVAVSKHWTAAEAAKHMAGRMDEWQRVGVLLIRKEFKFWRASIDRRPGIAPTAIQPPGR